jgi:hypothetical protein
MSPPRDFAEWQELLRVRCLRRNRELGIKSKRAIEVFTVTAWGEVPDFEQLLNDFPALARPHSNLKILRAKLKRWQPE